MLTSHETSITVHLKPSDYLTADPRPNSKTPNTKTFTNYVELIEEYTLDPHVIKMYEQLARDSKVLSIEELKGVQTGSIKVENRARSNQIRRN